MCAHCDKAIAEYGAGSEIAAAVAEWMHPPTPEQIAARRRAAKEMADTIAAWEDERDDA